MVGRVTVKRNFHPYNRRYTSPNEHFEYGYPHSNALFNIYSSKAQHFAPNWSFVRNVKQLCHPITSDVTYDVGAPTVYRTIYWCKFLTLSNQMLCYICKCIRICNTSLKVEIYMHSFGYVMRLMVYSFSTFEYSGEMQTHPHLLSVVQFLYFSYPHVSLYKWIPNLRIYWH